MRRRLNEFDARAHAEAASAPGFVYYFKGPSAPDGSCLSFCLWTGRTEARAAAGRPDHVEAVALVDEMYRGLHGSSSFAFGAMPMVDSSSNRTTDRDWTTSRRPDRRVRAQSPP